MFAATSPIDKVERRLVARLSDQIVGFVDINENHVRNLFVDPSQQGNKIGTQLIRKVEELVEGDITRNRSGGGKWLMWN